MRTLLIVWGALWSAPNTLFGLLCAAGGGTRFLRRDPTWGALLFLAKPGGLCDRWMNGGGFFGLVTNGVAAFTCGFVIVFGKESYVAEPMLTHENRHVWQGFICGPLHILVYGIGILVAKLQGKQPYRGCFLEEDARRHAGEPV